MADITQTLSQLALTKAEIELYLLLLQSPEQQIVDLVGETEYHRPRIMELLVSLEEKRLVTHELHGRRKVYSAAPPHVVVERAKAALADAQAILPELMQKQPKKRAVSTIKTLTGEEGLSACFLDVVLHLKKGDIFYRYSSASNQQYVDSLVPAEYRPIRDSKQLERKVITSAYVGEQKKKRLERSIRYFDESDELFEHNVIQFIYGDKISLLDFNTLTATIIQNKAITDFQKSIFLTLYKRLERTEKS